MIIKVEIGGHFIHRIYVDGGSASEILYERCFNRLCPKVQNQIVLATASLIGFSGEITWPIGQISPPDHRKARSKENLSSPVNGSRNVKFPVPGGILTLRSRKINPLECTMVSGPEVQPSASIQVAKEKIKVAIHPEYPEQTKAIGSTLTEEGRGNYATCLDVEEKEPSTGKKQGAIKIKNCKKAAKIEHRARFDATNNEAEYDALIVGLRITEQMGVKNLQAHVNSHLVANQINGSYIAKEPGMIQYLEKVQRKVNKQRKSVGNCRGRRKYLDDPNL
nr:reverse transcriptase domain-containing protein [Tanacetum cinerariifolium]